MPTSPPDKPFGTADPDLSRWAEKTFAPEDPVLAEIRERSVAAGLPAIAVGKMDGLHLEVLARLSRARKAVEIGTLGGYSGVCILRGMDEGVLHTFELSEKHAEVARESFRKAGVAERARVHVGPALRLLPEIEGEGPFDLCFIDADKTGYPAYLAWAEKNLKIGGVVIGDNAFGFGGVVRDVPGTDREGVLAIRKFNEELARSGRFRATMIPTSEGLAVGVRVR
ncbi:MAG: O-methyltransferase [Deltaproteobacteria bacterium]|nr:MAG: O-methyltransferase [Deltaproteobacteria bacterium]TMB35122.1 MAG: O-methyltransferase [Deltaproteobacteria bacterium]